MTTATDARDALVADLTEEQRALMDVLGDIGPEDWFRPVPAHGWDVRDTVAHLADTDEIALDTCTGGPRSLAAEADRAASPEDVTLAGVLRGRRHPGSAVLGWWERAAAAERSALSGLDPDVRVPWGLGMRVPSFVTARLMETWAHALDVHAALGTEPVDTARLRHVAWLAIRALPYAYSVAGREPPGDSVRFELVGPGGEAWVFGPPDATDRVTGPAGDLCRVFVQRRAAPETHLVAEGPAAVAALEVARAYL